MQVSKRPRTGATESFGGAGSVINPSMEVNNSSNAGATDDQAVSHWDWDNDDRVEMDIQILLSDFGDFGDFFENESLPFGEVFSRSLRLSSSIIAYLLFFDNIIILGSDEITIIIY